MDLGMGHLPPVSDRSFSPASLAGIAHWVSRADQGITIATGVSQWNDLIGTAHLIQSTERISPPTTRRMPAATGGRPCLSTATNHVPGVRGGGYDAAVLRFWL